MIWLRRHPRPEVLERFASDESAPEERPRVARHIEECARCAKTVTSSRTITAIARELSGPEPSPGLRERVLTDFRSGKSVDLARDDTTARRQLPRWVGVAVDCPDTYTFTTYHFARAGDTTDDAWSGSGGSCTGPQKT